MSEKQDDTKKPEEPKPPRSITDYAAEFLTDDAVAIIVKQHLSPDDVENPVIFPPTYLRARGKTHDDDKDEKDEKKESKKDQQKSVYNLDGPPDGDNVCEIDSPQSDGNKSEPLFKTDALKHLVPQIVISVNGNAVNLLDAGHRAGDAVVRLSSLAAEFHDAFLRADIGDHSILATLAPTSLLYGAWDSRSTQTKLQRIIKAGVRAQNVRPLTKSATFIPAVDYVALGAVKEELDVGEGDSNPLSSEGMKYALASQTLGGVRLTDPKLLMRTIKINLVALRQLKAIAKPPKAKDNDADKRKQEIEKATAEAPELSKTRTEALRKYLLGLALVTATSDPDLNLREGCNLRISGDDRWVLVRHRKDDESIGVDRANVLEFAKEAGQRFFKAMGIEFEKKDHLDATFQKDVAEEFLGLTDAKGKLSGVERDKVRKIGPITRETLDEYKRDKKKREKSGDPVEALQKLVDALKIGNNDKFNKGPREKLAVKVTDIEGDSDSSEDLKSRAGKIKSLLTEESGAAERKAQMLAFFPSAAPESPATTSAESSAEQTEGSAQ
jgi:CRISPR-associated protein Csb1